MEVTQEMLTALALTALRAFLGFCIVAALLVAVEAWRAGK